MHFNNFTLFFTTVQKSLNITQFLDTSAAMCKTPETLDFDTGKTAAENKQ